MTQLFDAFISYGRADSKAFAQKLQVRLDEAGFNVWFDFNDIPLAVDFQNQIDDGIEKASHFLFIIAPHSVNSPYCLKEIELAVKLNKRIIPLLHVMEISQETWQQRNPKGTESEWEAYKAKGLHESYQNMHPTIRKLNWVYFQEDVDLTDNIREEDYYWDENQLLKILHQDAAYYNEHKILLTKALKWKRQHENPSILLRGYNLRSAEAWLKVANKRTQHLPTPLIEEFIDESLRQPPATSLDVFISYSSADADFARKLNDELQIQGKRTWFDQESIASGADFVQEIHGGIEACDNFLFILSPRSVNSPYCKDEVEYADSLNKRFVTVLHQPVNSDELHPELGKVQWIDFNQNQQDFQVNFRQLVRTLNTDRDHLAYHTKWSQRAIEWKEKNYSADLLLRGSELAVAQAWLQETQRQKKKPGATELQKAYIAKSGGHKRRNRQVLTGAVVGVIGLVTAFWLRAESIATLATLREDAARAQLLLPIEPMEALTLAIQATGKSQSSLFTLKKVLPQVQSSLQDASRDVRERNQLRGHEDGVNSVAFSPDGQRIVSGSSDETIRLWDAEGNPIGQPFGHQGSVNSVAFSPDGQRIVSGSSDGTIRLWDAEGNPIGQPFGHQGSVNSVAFSPDGQKIVSGSSDGTIRLWDTEGNPIGQPFGHQGSVFSVTFSPDGQRIVSGSSDGTIRLWDAEGNPIGQPFKGHQDWVISVAFSPDGQRIVSGSADKTIRLWDTEGNPIGQPFKGHQDWVISVAFSPDGQRIVSGSADKTIRLWDTEGNPIGQPFKGHQDGVISVAFSPDGQRIVSGSADKTIRLWDTEGNPIGQPFKGHQDWVNSVAFSPDGQRIVSGSDDGTIRLWDAEGNPIGQPFKGHQDGVFSVAFSPDGQRIVSGSNDGTIRLWDTEGNPIGQPFKGHQDWVISVAFSPDGQTIVSGSADKTIRLWDTEGNPIGQPFEGHQDGVISVAFSPGGQTIVSGSADGTIRLWDTEGNPIGQPFEGHQDWVISVAFSPDGQTIVSGSADKTIRLWRGGNWQDWLDVACNNLINHPIFVAPETLVNEDSDRLKLAKAARKTCHYSVWNQTEKAQFLVNQGRAMAREGDMDAANAKFQQAQNLSANINLPTSEQVAGWAAEGWINRG